MEIQRLRWDDSRVASYIAKSQPIVLTHCPLAVPAANRWTTDYLNSILSKTFKHTVYVSESLMFRYWDESKNDTGYSTEGYMKKEEMTFSTFITKVRSHVASKADSLMASLLLEEELISTSTDSNKNKKNKKSNKNKDVKVDTTVSVDDINACNSTEYVSNDNKIVVFSMVAAVNSNIRSTDSLPKKQLYYYLQQSVVLDMGEQMMKEYMKFSLEAALKFKLMGNWDAFSTNLLLVAPAGAVTPLHFDEQENLFAQLVGTKRVRLFHPEAWKRLYPYPLHHACDRQSRVILPKSSYQKYLDIPQDNIRFPGFERYSNRNELKEYYVELQPGEVLYIPQFWWHQMESQTENTSLSWWFKNQFRGGQNNDYSKTGILDLSKVSFISVRRNLEKMIYQTAGGGRAAHNFFLALAAGKVQIPAPDGKKLTAPGRDDHHHIPNSSSSSNNNTSSISNHIPNSSSSSNNNTSSISNHSHSSNNSCSHSHSHSRKDSISTSNSTNSQSKSDGKASLASSSSSSSAATAAGDDEDEEQVECTCRELHDLGLQQQRSNTITDTDTGNMTTVTPPYPPSSSSSSSSTVTVAGGSARSTDTAPVQSPSSSSSSSSSSRKASLTLTKSPYFADHDIFNQFLPNDVLDFNRQHVTIPREAEKMIAQAVEIASYVLGPNDAPFFLKEMVSGRFANL